MLVDHIITSKFSLTSTFRNTLQEKEKELEKLRSSHPSANSGKQLHEVGKRQQRRKLAAIKESAKEALKFAETYKLDVK